MSHPESLSSLCTSAKQLEGSYMRRYELTGCPVSRACAALCSAIAASCHVPSIPQVVLGLLERVSAEANEARRGSEPTTTSRGGLN